MLHNKLLKVFIIFWIIMVFAAGCRFPEITEPNDDITIDPGDFVFEAASDPDAILYKWTFDGGAKNAYEQNPTVRFDRPGTYLVTLVVVFDDGESGADFVTVSVTGSTGPAPVAAMFPEGEGQAGVSWPDPRFTDNLDGTVTDNFTGLMWLKNANCIQTEYATFDTDDTVEDGQVTWQHALDFVSGINDGTYPDCGGGHTDWRLPNVKELQSLIYIAHYGPALPNTLGDGQWTSGDPFDNVQSAHYWSSTTEISSGEPFFVHLNQGTSWHEYEADRPFYFYVWPVRGGQ